MKSFLHTIILLMISLKAYSAVYDTNINMGSSHVPTSFVPKETRGVTIKENLGKTIDLNLQFTNQDGKKISLQDLVKDNKPFILTLNYYRCITLCGVQLENLAQSLKSLGWQIGKDFRVITVSFDPTDTPELAKKKQIQHLNAVTQPKGDWSFLVGNAENIKKITEQIGFFYKYLPERNEFSHTAAIFFISPKGIISRYLYGISYKVNDLKFSLMDASLEKIGSTTDRFLLFCCNYDPNAGQYTGLAIGLMRVIGIVMILLVAFFMFFYSKRRRKTA